MSDHSGDEKESAVESVMEKITEKFHGDDLSSDSDGEKSPSSVKAKVYRLFGREKPVHKVLGGGKRTKTNKTPLSLSLSLIPYFSCF